MNVVTTCGMALDVAIVPIAVHRVRSRFHAGTFVRVKNCRMLLYVFLAALMVVAVICSSVFHVILCPTILIVFAPFGVVLFHFVPTALYIMYLPPSL